MDNSNTDKIKKITGEFFEQMGFPAQVEISAPQELTIPIDVKIETPQFLIGKSGETLMDIQKILKFMLKKKIAPEKNFYIDLDINGYKKKKVEYLKEMAKSAADEVSLLRQEKKLAPMSGFERRIIHLELAGRTDITTESEGEGPERAVIIKPFP
jgi:spoIIIJ-associated protein